MGSVSHDDLDAAAEAAPPEPVAEEPEVETEESEVEATEEEVETEEVEAEPSAADGENQERSELGRKVQENTELVKLMLYQQQEAVRSKEKPEPEEDDEEDDIVMKKDLDKHLDKRSKKRAATRKEYESRTIEQIGTLGREVADDAQWKGITDMIGSYMDNKNYRPSSRDPRVEGELLFLKAKSVWMENQLKKDINPLDKNKDVPAKNLGGKTTTKTAPKKGMKALKSKEAIALAKHYGWNEEKINEALSEDQTNAGPM